MSKVTSRTYLLRVSVDLFKRNLWNTAWSMSSDNKNINIYIYNKNEKALKKKITSPIWSYRLRYNDQKEPGKLHPSSKTGLKHYIISIWHRNPNYPPLTVAVRDISTKTKTNLDHYLIVYWLELCNLPPWWSSVTGQSGFVYTISLRVGITSTRPARMLVRARRCVLLSHLSLLSCHPALSAAAILSPNARREPCGTSEAGLGGLHTSSDARPIWLARHWQEPSHESRWLTCGRIHRDWLPLGERDSPSVTELKEKME